MTQITSVTAAVVVVPLAVPTAFSSRVVSERHYVLVRVEGSDKQHGIGFCYAGSSGGELVALAVRSLLAPVVVGQDAHRTEGLWGDMYQESLLHGRAGSVLRALSAIDIALWDRNARAASLPLWKYLGAHAASVVPAYASGGYYLPGKTADDLAAEMAGYVGLGFTAVKLKVGRLSIDEDAKRIAAVREAVGPSVRVMLDANNAWSDLPTARAAARAWRRFDPYWLEEPFGPDDISSHQQLAAEGIVTIATGEIEVGRWRHRELLERHAADFLQTDAAVCGGITEWRRIAALASAFGVSMAPHWFHDLHVHLVAATPNAQLVEFFPTSEVLNFRELVDTQLTYSAGNLHLPEKVGLGFDFLEEAVRQYSTEGFR